MTVRVGRRILPGLAALVVLLAFGSPARASGAAYCVAQSGPNGSNSYVSNCIYSTYQQCLSAVAGSRGNCVANVEFSGDVRAPTLRGAGRSR